MLLGGEEAADAAEDTEKHGVGEAAGESVLLAGVISAEKAGEIAREFVNRAVAERELRESCDAATVFEDLEVGFQGDAAKDEDGFGPEEIEFSFEI